MSAPTPFGKYLLVDRISIGGMAEVFRAKLVADRAERLFAIKRILPSLCEDTNFIKMFVEEARLAGQLVHPNICAIHELGRADGAHFLAMEYIWGKDLIQVRTRLRKQKQKVPLAICVYIMVHVLDGLDYAHRKRDPLGRSLGLVHRDLSPHNVLVSYEGEVKVIDFGIAKADTRGSMTQAGTLKGKFAYMSPEQVSGGKKLDRRSDIFALGTLLFELVTGERLFFGESDFNTLERVKKVEVKPPREIDPSIPEGVEKIIYRALSKEPEGRYQWCSEMRAELEPFLTVDAVTVSAWMKTIFAAEIPVEREQIEFGLAMGRGRTPPGTTTPLPSSDTPADVPIPGPAALPPRRAGNVVVEDNRSKGGGGSSKLKAATSIHIEDQRSAPRVIAPSAPIEPTPPPPAKEEVRPRRTSAQIPAVAAPVLPALGTPLRRAKAPSLGLDDFKDEPPTNASDDPAFPGGADWSEPQQTVDWSESLELSEHAAAPPKRPKWPEPPVQTQTAQTQPVPETAEKFIKPPPPTQTLNERPRKWVDTTPPTEMTQRPHRATDCQAPQWPEKVPTEPMWSEQETAWNEPAAVGAEPMWSDAAETAWNMRSVDTLPPESQWSEQETAWNEPQDTGDEPVIEQLEHDPALDLLDLAPESTQDELLDVPVEVQPPEPEPEPDPPPNKVLRLGGGNRFRPNRNRR